MGFPKGELQVHAIHVRQVAIGLLLLHLRDFAIGE